MIRPIADQARLDFALSLRRQWAASVYPRLRAEYDAVPGGRRSTIANASRVVHALPGYGPFAWLERGSQQLLWHAVSEAVEHEAPPPEPPPGPSTLVLDPKLKLPGWYTDWDIHLQPGGVWSSDQAARVYELGARLVMLGENDDYEFHRLFTSSAVPARDYRRIVDLGCGFGKSTFPLRQRFPEAEVIGVDLAAPCLRLALRRANERGLRITFRQADCTKTGLPSGCADLVTSTMLLHELPRAVLPRLFREAARLLAPAGLLRFLDFQYTGDAFRDLAMREHGARNNEPYLAPMLAADIRGMARAAGLRDAAWRAFDERGRGLLEGLHWPARREWHFPWAVLGAEMPA
ncbi:MAG TPA: methyltransferase domain-containing protein [Steroidobacteraceae bacterium]|jgi:ubiquinone/menaquinone biosynthesis C-methylase UbiE